MASQNTTVINKKKSSFRKSVFTGDSKDTYIICGNLLKNTPSNLVTPWQTRYFAASGHYLKYYKTEDVAGRKDYCLGAIDMNLCEAIDPVDNVFILMDKEVEIMTLKAKDNEQALNWVNTLRSMKQDDGGTPETINEEDEEQQQDEGDNGNESDDGRDDAFLEQTTSSSLLTALDDNDDDAMSISSNVLLETLPPVPSPSSPASSLPNKNHLSSKLTKEELKINSTTSAQRIETKSWRSE